MQRLRTPIVGLAALMLIAGCPSDDTAVNDDLDDGPQILAGGTGSSVLFALTPAGESDVRDVVLLNVGRDLLRIRGVRLEGSNPGAFAIETELASEAQVRPREAYGVRVSFNPGSRGLSIAELVVDSNAGEAPELRVELIGPAGTNPLTDGPDIAAVSRTVELPVRDDGTAGMAQARYMNLGIGTLVVTSYELSDTTNFAIGVGTPVPGVSCATDGLCAPEGDQTQGCCELTCKGLCDGGSLDGLDCSAPCPGLTASDPEVACLDPVCSAFTVGGGELISVPIGVAAGATVTGDYAAALHIYSNDPDNPHQQISVEGSL